MQVTQNFEIYQFVVKFNAKKREEFCWQLMRGKNIEKGLKWIKI